MDGATRTNRARPTASRNPLKRHRKGPDWQNLRTEALALVGKALVKEMRRRMGKPIKQAHAQAVNALRQKDTKALLATLQTLHCLLDPIVAHALARPMPGERRIRYKVLTAHFALQALTEPDLAYADMALGQARANWSYYCHAND